MRITFILASNRAELLLALDLLVGLNLLTMAHGPALPPLYASGVRYAPEPKGQDDWLMAHQVYRRRKGDCEDVTCWRVAELRRAGERAEPDCYRTRTGRWHAVVRRGDGQREDPSRILGMGKHH